MPYGTVYFQQYCNSGRNRQVFLSFLSTNRKLIYWLETRLLISILASARLGGKDDSRTMYFDNESMFKLFWAVWDTGPESVGRVAAGEDKNR